MTEERMCKENVIANCAHHGIPLPATVTLVAVDRMKFQATEDEYNAVARRMLDLKDQGKFTLDSIVNSVHGPDAVSYREDVWKGSMQVCLSPSQRTVEVDFDVFHPGRDLAGLIGHAIELWDPSKTQPARIRRYLIGRGLEFPATEVRNA